jgi:hypothetical protein
MVLYQCCLDKKLHSVAEILRKNVNLNWRTEDGFSSFAATMINLHAEENDRTPIVQLLLDAGIERTPGGCNTVLQISNY